MAKRIWTYENRCLLYRKMVDRFGPYHTWGAGATDYPVGKKRQFELFLDEMANMFSTIMEKQISREAVYMQFAWAATPQKSVEGSYTSMYILNMAAAYEQGFLRSCDFPQYLLMERENPNLGDL
jgi:hypothetical protein